MKQTDDLEIQPLREVGIMWMMNPDYESHIPPASVLIKQSNTGPPGEHLPYWDQIPYTRFLFDFW
jgi:hypothetical protein